MNTIGSSRSGRRPEKNNGSMRKTRKPSRSPSAESIARLADQDQDVSRFFTNTGRMVRPAQTVMVDFTPEMRSELEVAARELNVRLPDLIKLFVRRALDEHYLARKARTVG